VKKIENIIVVLGVANPNPVSPIVKTIVMTIVSSTLSPLDLDLAGLNVQL